MTVWAGGSAFALMKVKDSKNPGGGTAALRGWGRDNRSAGNQVITLEDGRTCAEADFKDHAGSPPHAITVFKAMTRLFAPPGL